MREKKKNKNKFSIGMQSNKEERRNLPFNVIYVSFSPRISTPLAKLSLVEYIPLALDKLMVNTMGKRFLFLFFFVFFVKKIFLCSSRVLGVSSTSSYSKLQHHRQNDVLKTNHWHHLPSSPIHGRIHPFHRPHHVPF